MVKQKNIPFLCTGNYYRSRFAEVLFVSVARKMGLPWDASSRALAIERGVKNVGPMATAAIKALEARIEIFAWYNLVGSVSTAVGALVGGCVSQVLLKGGFNGATVYRHQTKEKVDAAFNEHIVGCNLAAGVISSNEGR